MKSPAGLDYFFSIATQRNGLVKVWMMLKHYHKKGSDLQIPRLTDLKGNVFEPLWDGVYKQLGNKFRAIWIADSSQPRRLAECWVSTFRGHDRGWRSTGQISLQLTLLFALSLLVRPIPETYSAWWTIFWGWECMPRPNIYIYFFEIGHSMHGWLLKR